MDCCGQVTGSDCHCAKCHETFRGLTLFDQHQDVDYSRPHADSVRCRDPRALGLSQDVSGSWCTPEGLKQREILRGRLATARSGRAQGAA